MDTTDLRFALRHFARQPRFAITVVVTLALGIGSVTALFSVADAVLWRPLPFAEPERLVRVWGEHRGDPRNNLNPLDALDFRAQVGSFDSLAVLHLTRGTLTGAGEPLALTVGRVSADFFATLGIDPALGRFFGRQEEEPGSERVVVLSHELWQRAFGGDSGVLGRAVSLGGEPYTIVGVAPPGARHFAWELERRADLWRPLAVDPRRQGRGGHFVHAAARLAPGATVEGAQAELSAVVARLAREHPDLAPYWGARVEPLHEAVAGPARRGVVLLLGAGALVLLVACANVATLLLARAVARRGEVGVRVALGAGAGRLLRQMLVEAGLLASAGALAGLAFAAALVAGLRQLGAAQIPRLELAEIDGTTLAAAAGAAALTVLLFGLLPALRLARLGRANPAAARGAAARGHRLERGLVVAEVALSLTLLVGAGLLLQSLWRVLRVDMGMRPERAVSFGVAFTGRPLAADAPAAYARLERRLAALPGVEAVGWTSHVPLSGAYSCDGVFPEGSPAVSADDDVCAEARAATPGYFPALGLRLVAGRLLDERDAAGAAPVVVVNRTLAASWWPGERAVGRRLKWGGAASDDPWREVVGVVADVRHFGLDEPALPEVYSPHAQLPYDNMYAVVRTAGDPAALIAEAARVVREMDPGVPLVDPRPMAELVAGSVAVRRLRAGLLGGFAALALLLCGIGVYGVMSHLVGERRGEIGVRMAVGARSGQVLRAVLREGLALGAAGLVAGAAGVLAMPRLLGGLLFGVEPLDPPTLAAAALALLAVAALAAWLPARRAAAVDPVRVLRDG